MTPSCFCSHADGTPASIDAPERGPLVPIESTAVRIDGEREFRPQNATGIVRVNVGSDRVPADMGEVIRIKGLIDDDPLGPLGPLGIHMRSLPYGDGTVVPLGKRHERASHPPRRQSR